AGERWTLSSDRTKNHREHVLPLVRSATALLPPRRPDCNYVFGNGPRREGDQRRGFSGWSKSKLALDARIHTARTMVDARAKPLPHWTLHDLRRTAATMMTDRLGVLPHIVEAILNHMSGHRAGVAGIYNRARYQVEMRGALERWTQHLF